jgi:hypothetical protein
MSRNVSHCPSWVLLLVAAAGGLFFYLAQNNWTLHARLNLVLHGHVFCRLESPEKLNELPPPRPTEFVSKLVYAKGTYVGYLNPYGDFISASKGALDWEVQRKITMVLFILECAFVAAFVGILLHWLWRAWKQGHSQSNHCSLSKA